VDWKLTILRLIHIFGAVIWFGWGFVSDFITERAVRQAGAAGSVTWGRYIAGTGQAILLPVVTTLTVVSGGWLLADVWGFGEITTRAEWALNIGAAAGIAAWVWGAIKYAPIGKQVGLVMAEIGSGQPTPEQVSRLDALRAQSLRAGYVSMVLLVIAMGTMAAHRYLGF
jgi:hypothetical protein